jgi:mannose-1-phosphate guanylyltransferase
MGQVAFLRGFGQLDAQAIILAAGDGQRLSRLTQRLYGRHVPKQFAELAGGRSLLQETVLRMTALVPPHQMTVVVPSAYASLSREQLAPWPGVRVVVQPANRGTAPGLLLPLAGVLANTPDAKVVVTASDHYVPQARPFIDAIASALEAASTARFVLLGARPDRPETDYGWILPGASLGNNLYEIAGFVEKPAHLEAVRLQKAGALWNTFVMAAQGKVLWQSIASFMPDIAKVIAALWDQPRSLAAAYRAMPSVGLSRSVLKNMTSLSVVPVSGSGWTDWGSPERVFESMQGTDQLAPLMKRIREQDHA